MPNSETQYVTEIIHDPLRFAALADMWDDLAAQMGTPLALHAWYAAALSAQHLQHFELYVVIIWEGGRIAAAAPFMLDHALAPARLVPIDAFPGEPDRLLSRGPAALAVLADACAGLGRPILVRRLVACDADLAVLSSALRSSAMVLCSPRHESAAVRLPANFAVFEQGISSSRRSTIRRKWRAAEREHGKVEAEFIMPEAGNLVRQLARIEAIEGSGWKGRSGTALSADSRMRHFVERLAASFAKEGRLVLAFLRIGDRDAACRLILSYRSTWSEIKIGYDEEFARFSPGLLMMNETLREACRTGIESYAFLGLRESWQDHWPHEVIQDFRLSTYPFRPSGVLALADDGWMSAARFVRNLRG
jgi:CelD/BcsL family acetyltransferase involved in cellulose biosynthesis